MNFLPTFAIDIRVLRTFIFSYNGHALYMSSPSEIQKISLAENMIYELKDMIGEYFTPELENPEPPRLSFFRGLFSGGATTSTLDREELFGVETPAAAGANNRGGAAAAGKTAADMRAKVRARE